jgi:group II intron reverse transcriptase/maturase
MILESVYEPIFLDCSHGFRPKRSCHTALQSIKKGFNGSRWFIEGDIKGCFDNIEHNTLISLINKKVKDMRIIKLLWKFLKAGYMENWKYHATYSGCPQGGIISPLLSNIYLHELDKFAMKFADRFNFPPSRTRTKEYKSIEWKCGTIRKKIGRTANEAEKQMLLNELKTTRATLLKTPCKMQDDKKIKYVRYADDFIIAVNGSKEDCVSIKRQFADFIAGTLKMELSEEKTLVTHSNDYARFLGYDVRVRRCDKVKVSGKITKRTLNNMVELNIPLQDKIMKFLFAKGIISQKQDGSVEPVHRNRLIRCTPLEIVSTYNAELRGICNYYSLGSNFTMLNYFSYLMEYSCLKTLACKHKSNIGKIKNKYKDGKGKWGIQYETKKGIKRCYLAKHSDCRKSKDPSDYITTAENMYRLSRTTLESRLSAKECELCGTVEAKQYEIHHINKVKNLKGKYHWEKVMIAKRRKTLVVCKTCHDKIHSKNGNKK